MSKTERQINLVFLLLNSKRGLTRSQIKESISDYRNSVSSSAFERMFERDKDELRGIGFFLESNQDMFSSSDEIYYKIKREDSFLNIDNLSLTDRLLLQIARSNLIINSDTPLRTLMKLDTVPLSENIQVGTTEPAKYSESILLILEAIADKKRITFPYQSRLSFETETREVMPLRLIFRNMCHYLIGYDLNRADFRTYRLDRIFAPITQGIVDNFIYSLEKINDFDKFMTEVQTKVVCQVTVDPGVALDESFSSINITRDNQNTYKLSCSEFDLDYLFRYLLRNLDHISNIQPASIEAEFREYLGRVQNVQF